MAIGKLPPHCSAVTRLAYRPDRTFAAGKLGHLRIRLRRRSVLEKYYYEAQSLRRYHARKRNVSQSQYREHNTFCGQLPTAAYGRKRTFSKACTEGRARLQGLGTSSLNRPAPPWPSGFSSSGRIAFNSPSSIQGGLTSNSPAETSAESAVWGAALNSSRRHFAGEGPAAAISATLRARPSVARRLLAGYHNR